MDSPHLLLSEGELDEMGVSVLEPTSRKERNFADALGAFSTFILDDEHEMSRSIIDRRLGLDAGQLQGGSEEYEIYRLSIYHEDDDDNENTTAAALLLSKFHASAQGKRYTNILTMAKLQQYMLGMCERQNNHLQTATNATNTRYKLGNLMFLLSFGPTPGQVRHIDAMDPNCQICLYMSRDCPSTVIYQMEGPHIRNVHDLLECWRANIFVPDLVQELLLQHGDTPLDSKWHCKYFTTYSNYNTINALLYDFGKLYQKVSKTFSLPTTDPGTTLVVGGSNQVHAGPSCHGPRMFAFAIGIPPPQDCTTSNNDGDNHRHSNVDNEDKDGEVQYNPTTLHVDLCTILFGIMDYDYCASTTVSEDDLNKQIDTAKRFLLQILLVHVEEYPNETYARLIGNDRKDLRDWLGRLVQCYQRQDDDDSDHDKNAQTAAIQALFQQALESDTIFYTPNINGSGKRMKKRRTNTKKGSRRKNR